FGHDRGLGGLGAAVDGRVLGDARAEADADGMGGAGHRFPRRGLAQRRQQPGVHAGRAGRPAGRRAGLVVGLDLEPRPRPAFAVHGRGRADAVRRRGDVRGRRPARRTLPRPAHGARHRRLLLPGRDRLDRRVLRLHLAAAPRAAGAGQQLCLRQPGDRGDAGRVAGARALRRARTGGDGRDPARRGGDHRGQGAQAEGGGVSAGRLDRGGVWIAVAAYVAWGLMPLYWHLLKMVPSLQIIAHRVVWSALLVGGWLCLKYGRGWLRETLSRPRAAAMLALSGVLIAFNWGLYIWAVNAGHVVETALGYFINPLLNVVLGVVVLHERLNRVQWLAVAIAAAGVLWLTFNYGSFPWIALALAASFGAYGLVRQLLGAPPVRGLGVESLYLLLPALAFLVWTEASGRAHLLAHADAPGWGAGVVGLLVFGGVLTALPLIGFAAAVQRIPYSLVGLLQYISPTLQLLAGVLILHEPFGRDRAVGFAFIWVALALYAADGLWRSRRRAAVSAT